MRPTRKPRARRSTPATTLLLDNRSRRGSLRSGRCERNFPAWDSDDAARYEIDFRLRIKERDYEDAVLAAYGLTFDAVADDGLVIAGQPVKLSILAVNHGTSDVSVRGVSIAGLDVRVPCAPGAVKKDAVYTCTSETSVPQNADLTTPYFHDNYWKHPENQAIQIFDPGVEFGVPFAPTPYRVTFHIKAGDTEVARELPIEYRYIKDIYLGDKRMELNVVPTAFGSCHFRSGCDSGVWGRFLFRGHARGARLCYERDEGRGWGFRVAGSTEWLEGDPGERAAQLCARRRVLVGQVRSGRSSAGEGRPVHAARNRHLAGFPE